MLYSIVTPTHSKENVPNLIELYVSIVNQTYINWEWILYLNNGMKISDLPDFIVKDSRVKKFEQQENNSNIGHIKNKAFFEARGSVLVEADHDDMLAVNCLEELHKVFSTEKDVGFVYSNSLLLSLNEVETPYREDYGWKHQAFEFKGRKRLVPIQFEPTSHSLSCIWYAPDHVRAWKREIYHKLGGHNKSFEVCDDHELLIRTYLNTKMKHINMPLYVYRLTKNNTSKVKNEKIQKATNALFDSYIEKLAERDSTLNVSLKNSYKDYIQVDNINKLENDSVGIFKADNVLQYSKNCTKSISEIYRVLKHGGWAFITVPSTDGRGAWQNPLYKSFWNQNSFFYYIRKDYAKTIDNKNIRFQVYKLNTSFPSNFHKINNISITKAILVAIKNDEIRYPGPLLI